MNEEYNKHLEDAELFTKKNHKLIGKMRKGKTKMVDKEIHSLHDEAFENIDCLECANCCKTTSPIFRDVDIERLSKHFRIKTAQFVEQYLHMDDVGDYVLNETPCAFLGEDNYCTVYDHRPKACQGYPHTDRKNQQQIIHTSYENTFVCPAVAHIFEQLRKTHIINPK